MTRIVAPGSEKRPLMDVWSAASVTLIGIDCRSIREAPLTGRVVGCRLWSLPVAILDLLELMVGLSEKRPSRVVWSVAVFSPCPLLFLTLTVLAI